MVLQSLTKLYDDLLNRGSIPMPGWGTTKVRFALCLDENGTLSRMRPLVSEVQTKKKTILRPQLMELPAAVTRAMNISSNFLWDNSTYILGVDEKGKPDRSLEAFRVCAKLHHTILDDLESPAASAVLRFFDSWEPEQAHEHPALQEYWDDIMKGGNLVFQIGEQFAQDDPEIRSAWCIHYNRTPGALEECLVTGEKEVVEKVHPKIKGVYNAQSSGASLVSYNAPAFCSYEKKQGMNAPVGKPAAFAYTSALNYLLADPNSMRRFGEVTIVYWAEGGDPIYSEFAATLLFGEDPPYNLNEEERDNVASRLANGISCDEWNLDPNRTFYILGISPNAARLSVRFFLQDTYGNFVNHICLHNSRMEIDGLRGTKMPLWVLLQETVNQKTSDKSPSPLLVGAVARAILTDTPYPPLLLEYVMMRIRSEQTITARRIAIIKAYYLKNNILKLPEEVFSVSLNPNSTNIPYNLGRLFAVYEVIQKHAIPSVNASIKDKYINAAASTPERIFPFLDKMCMKHLRKLDYGLRYYYEDMVSDLKNRQNETIPKLLSQEEQSSFFIGYYHQKEFIFTKKEKKEQ